MAGVPVAGRFGVAWVVAEAGQPRVYGVAFLDSSVCELGPSRPEPVVGLARLRGKTGGLGHEQHRGGDLAESPYGAEPLDEPAPATRCAV